MIDAIHHDMADRIDGLPGARNTTRRDVGGDGVLGAVTETDVRRPVETTLRPLENQPLPDETGEGLICAQFGGGGGI